MATDALTQIMWDTKALLNITDSSADTVISLIIKDCINAVKAYCRLEILPIQLYGTVSQMAIKRYKSEYISNIGAAGDVTSVTEGDRRIDFSVPEKNIIYDYAERLKPFINRRGTLPSEMEGQNGE